MMSDNEKIVSRIDSLAKSKGTSIAEIERSVGFGNGKIGKWKKAPKSPPFESLSVVANHLETTISYLTGETDDPSAGIKKERPADGEARVCDLPESIQKIINICLDRPELASALLTLAQRLIVNRLLIHIRLLSEHHLSSFSQ